MFNRKLKEKILALENKIYILENILKLAIKCSNCNQPANFMIYRWYEGCFGPLTAVDKLLCDKCLKEIQKD